MSQSWTEVWKLGHGLRPRDLLSIRRIDEMASQLTGRRAWPDTESVYRVLAAADRLTSAAKWLVLHMGFAHRIDVTGAPLRAGDFKKVPAEHMAASLSMVPAVVGYLTANVLSGRTRSWVMGQVHGVAALAAVDALTGGFACGKKDRHGGKQDCLSSLFENFRTRANRTDGRSPAESIADLTSIEMQYMHLPLRGENLVAFLDPDAGDGRGTLDDSLRWWRAEDCGLVTPVAILGASMSAARDSEFGSGDAACVDRRLRSCGFDPITIDGNDPAAFAWAILESEGRLKRFTSNPNRVYPAAMPYVIATVDQGLGMADGEPALERNLRFRESVHIDAEFRRWFNGAAAALFVPAPELAAAVGVLQTHALQGRPLESRFGLAAR